ncbi:MAG: 16S rRNA (guanine(966)-N(2))-methyltransferase RsmD [Acutalibacteraceae bacterium]|jgi:16S rRNA (guanine966-N2)-methyltransferase
MRVITGFLKNRRLIAPEGYDVRPTPDRVKEGIFSAIQFDIEGRRILDLFAGSGQLGIEALSRGAEFAVFVDSSKESLKAVKSNIEACGLQSKSRVLQSDYSSFCATCRDTFDYAFLDPPYSAGILLSAVKAVAPLMSDYGTIICEHPPEVTLEPIIGDFQLERTYRYGRVLVSMYKKKENLND